MNTNKLLKKMLMAATLLALLFSTACASNEIQSTDGQALIEKGDVFMNCLNEADYECAYELMSPGAQHLLEDAKRLADGVVNLDAVIKTYAPRISEWTFDRAQFSTKGGTTIGYLKGKVEFADGIRGTVSLEFEKDGETWKVRSSNLHYGLHTGISLGLGK